MTERLPPQNPERLNDKIEPAEEPTNNAPENTESMEEKKERTDSTTETSADLDDLKAENLEKQIDGAGSPRNEVPPNEVVPGEVTDVKNETIAARFFSKLDLKGMVKKLGEFRNKLAFMAGSLISQIKELGIFKNTKMLDTISAFIGADRAQLAEAMKVHGFEGVTEKGKSNMKSLMAVHKQKFSKVPLETFFLRVSENARKALKDQGIEGSATVDFALLTAVANGADFSDVEAKKPAEKAEATPETFLTHGDLLNESAPVKIDGNVLSAKKSPAGFTSSFEDGTSKSYKLKAEGLLDLRIKQSVIRDTKEMDIVVNYSGGQLKGKVPSETVLDIVRRQVVPATAKITLQNAEGEDVDLTFETV